MNNKLKISIITVSYNAARTIEQTIQSVVNQTYDNIEYIIIDGGSTDGTVDIIKKYENKIAYWVSEPDDGIYDAMNKGIIESTGEWVYIIGADDALYDKNTIFHIIKYLKQDIDVLSGVVWGVDGNSMIQYLSSNNYPLSREEDILRGSIKAHHQGLFIRSVIMKKLLFDVSYEIGADFKLLLQIWTTPEYYILKIKEPIAFFSLEGKGSRLKNIRKIEHKKIINEFRDRFSDKTIKKMLKDDTLYFILKSNIKKWIKDFLVKLKLANIVVKYKWADGQNAKVIHSCEWENCRWCKKLKKY